VADGVKLPALTGVRALAALAVYASHVGPPEGAPEAIVTMMGSGYSGVTLFFVLSGFVLTLGSFDELSRPSAGAVGRFFARRAARILPLYLVVLGFIALWRVNDGRSAGGIGRHFLGLQAWDSNVLRAYAFNPPAWSVSVELFLYACFPIVAVVMARLTTVRALAVAMTAVVIVMLSLAAIFETTHLADLFIYDPSGSHRWLYRNPAARLGDFVLGVTAARIVVLTRGTRRARRVGSVLAVVGGASFVGAMAIRPLYFSAWSWDVLYAVPAAALVAGLAAAPRGVVGRAIGHRVLVRLGEASYAFYLVHFGLLAAFDSGRWRTHLGASEVITEVWILLAIVAIAMGLHLALERPVYEAVRRSTFGRRPPATTTSLV